MTDVEQEHSQSLDRLHDAVYDLQEQVNRIEQTFTLIVNLMNQSLEQREGANG